MDTIDKLAFNPDILTYGMIGMTTIILAALTVFDSTSTEEGQDTDDGFVSQLLGKEEQNEAGLISSILPSSISGDSQSQMGGKTRRRHHNNKKKHRKTRNHKK